MLDIKFVRENPEIVKQNIRNKFQDSKLELVDKVLELDKENREIKQEVEALRAERNKISKQIGALMGQGKKEEAEEVKKQVAASGARIEELSTREKEVEEELLKNMMVIPNIIDPSVPIGGNLAGLAIGLTLVLVHIVCIPVTGTSVNPARSIGPALFQGGEALSQLWLFIVAPFVGAALSAVVWKVLAAKEGK